MSAADKLLRDVIDWQAIAVALAAAHAGTPEGAHHLVEAKRYGVIYDGLCEILAAASPAPVPDEQAGEWQWVPKEPTHNMRSACHLARAANKGTDDLWAAMLASAPPRPVAAEKREPMTERIVNAAMAWEEGPFPSPLPGACIELRDAVIAYRNAHGIDTHSLPATEKREPLTLSNDEINKIVDATVPDGYGGLSSDSLYGEFAADCIRAALKHLGIVTHTSTGEDA